MRQKKYKTYFVLDLKYLFQNDSMHKMHEKYYWADFMELISL